MFITAVYLILMPHSYYILCCQQACPNTLGMFNLKFIICTAQCETHEVTGFRKLSAVVQVRRWKQFKVIA